MTSEPHQHVKVWDPFVRIFHWTTVIVVLANFTVLDEDGLAHAWGGYLVFGLVLARIAWGFVGTKYARFSAFWPTPAAIRRHVGSYFGGRDEPHISHNPLGALMVLNLLAVLLLLGITGFMMRDGGFGDAEWVEEAHEAIAYYGLVSIVLHVAGVIVETLRSGVNLVGAMFTGAKDMPDPMG